VRLITDPEFSVTAEVASTGAIGILHGRGASALVLQDVAAGWDVPIGAEVTTSGIELSASIRSIFPRGLSIGRVIAVTSLDSSVLQTADIQPILNTETARVLLVIVNYDGGLPIPSAAP
jgi:cell shape-determining protein MreC